MLKILQKNALKIPLITPKKLLSTKFQLASIAPVTANIIPIVSNQFNFSCKKISPKIKLNIMVTLSYSELMVPPTSFIARNQKILPRRAKKETRHMLFAYVFRIFLW
jgi:hypothetical protein